MRQVSIKRKQRVNIGNVDIRAVLDALGIHYTEHGKNVSTGWIGTECPWCSDQSNNLGICLKSPVVSCFKCGAKGNLIKYLSEITGNFQKALEILQEHSSRELQIEEYDKSRVSKVILPKEATTKISPYHAGYLKNRKFDPVELFNLYNLMCVGPIS